MHAAAGQRPAEARLDPQAGHVAVPGGYIWWQRVGRGSKTPLVLLHGGPGGAHYYLRSLLRLAVDRPVIVYDQLGCGLSDAPDDPALYRIDRFVEELDCLREALGLSRIALYGHSWGSILAIEYLLTGRQAGVEKLILGGAIPSVPLFNAGLRALMAELLGADGEHLYLLDQAGETWAEDYGRLARQFFDSHALRVPPTPDHEASISSLARSPSRRVMKGHGNILLNGTLRHWERRPDLGRITVPTFVVGGAFDQVSLACHEAARDGIPGARLQIMEGCSHVPMIERPEAYNAALAAFLDG